MLRHSHLWTLGAAFAAVACWQAAHSSAPPKEEDAELYRLFVDAVEHVDRSYVQKVERRALVQNAIRGMLEQLDPFQKLLRDDRVGIDVHPIQRRRQPFMTSERFHRGLLVSLAIFV